MNTKASNSASLGPVETYIFFDGRCDEALEFYKKSIGAEIVALMRYSDSPDVTMCQDVPPDKVMHSVVKIGNSTFMASDGRCQGKASFEGFSLSCSVPNEAEADRVFAALSDGGQVIMPLMKTFYSPRFGMLIDRFGLQWMVIVPDPSCQAPA